MAKVEAVHSEVRAVRIEVEFSDGRIRRLTGAAADAWLAAASSLSVQNHQVLVAAWEVSKSAQACVADWVRTTLGAVVASNAAERSLRAAEEAIELAQACGADADSVHRLVDYVFSRPAGEPGQEIAGTLVSTYAVAAALGVNANEVLDVELARIHTPEVIERVRRRQAEKREVVRAPAVDQPKEG